MSLSNLMFRCTAVVFFAIALSSSCSKSGGKTEQNTDPGVQGTESTDGAGGTDTNAQGGTDTGNGGSDSGNVVIDTDINNKTGEICDNGIDDDGDRALDCADAECADAGACVDVKVPENCNDGRDNDLDGQVDCQDSDCANQLYCQEDCRNGEDDDGNGQVDCEDAKCLGVDPACGEVCGDGLDNDGDGKFDCDDPDCADQNPPCGPDVTDTDSETSGGVDGLVCSYNGEAPHTCACADALDNDGDGAVDNEDLHCFGPFDDDEESFATGIPGDNEGSKGYTECPFDGNSGIGNDAICCNPADPTQNVVPNGCDNRACCEVDVNGNGTGETVGIYGDCVFAPACGDDGTHGCPCANEDDCDAGQYCVNDKNTGDGFCSSCAPCTPDELCDNPCSCGETCFGGFKRPDAECGTGGDADADSDTDTDTDADTDTAVDTESDTGGTVDTDSSVDTGPPPDSDTGVGTDTGGKACPNGLDACVIDADCGSDGYRSCVGGCCYLKCNEGVMPCETQSDCDQGYMCVTGCCIQSVII